MSIEILPVLLFIVPLAAAFALYFPSRRGNKPSKIFTFLSLVANLIIAIKLFKYVVVSGPVITVFSKWVPPLGINFYADFMAVIWLLFGNMLAMFALFSSRLSYTWRFHGLILLMSAALNGLILSGDIFNIFVFFEILCLVSFALVAYYKRKESIEAGIKYFVLGSVASAMLLIAIALIYGKAGTLNLAGLSLASASWPIGFKMLVFGLLLIGLGVESGIFPMNGWLFDAHPAAPYPVSAMLSGIVIESSLYVLLRVKALVFPEPVFAKILLLLGVLTFVISEAVGFFQRDAKRLLAYSSAGQIGLMLIAFSINTTFGFIAGLLLFVNHLLSKGLLFISVGAMSDRSNSRDLNSFASESVFADKVAVITGGLSLLGVPPSLGFVGKILLFIGLAKASLLGVAYLLVPFIVIEALYIMRLISRVYLSDGKGHLECPGQLVAQWLLSLLLLALPSIVLTNGQLKNNFAKKIIKPINARQYVASVNGLTRKGIDG